MQYRWFIDIECMRARALRYIENLLKLFLKQIREYELLVCFESESTNKCCRNANQNETKEEEKTKLNCVRWKSYKFSTLAYERRPANAERHIVQTQYTYSHPLIG